MPVKTFLQAAASDTQAPVRSLASAAAARRKRAIKAPSKAMGLGTLGPRSEADHSFIWVFSDIASKKPRLSKLHEFRVELLLAPRHFARPRRSVCLNILMSQASRQLLLSGAWLNRDACRCFGNCWQLAGVGRAKSTPIKLV